MGLSVTDVDLVIYQGRWFSEELNDRGVRFTPWVNIDEWEFIGMIEQIEKGAKYQVRILKQVAIQGYGVIETLSVPDIKINPGL